MDLNPIGDNHIEIVWPKGECDLSDWHQILSDIRARELQTKLNGYFKQKEELRSGQSIQTR